jgi:chloride channel protein, CIC family
MQQRFSSKVGLAIRHNLARLEGFFLLLKSLLSERHFIYISAVLVGLSTAFAVIILKSFAHNVFRLATYVNGYLKLPYINSILPIVGILLTVLVIKRLLGNKIEKGSSRILVAVAKKGGIMPRKQMYSQIITSSLTVGLGGSAGLESPITITGAAFGSNFARKYKLHRKDRILMLACGVAAGIGAAFNAPIAGVLFAIEVVLTDVSITAFIPIMIAAATGALTSTIILDEEVLLTFRQKQEFDYHNILYYILLGILAGFVSLYHAKVFQKVEGHFSKLRIKGYRKALYGAIPLAVLIFLFPTLFGEGYESIRILSAPNPEVLLDNTLLENVKSKEWILLLFVTLTMLIKAVATGLTLASGGNGGNFAPSLFVGSYLGFIIAKFFNLIGFSHLPVANFTLVGMAGILSGLFHAPLTSIFLIAEITGGYNLMVPLMLVSSISFAVSKQFETYSMDVKHLAAKGSVFTSDKDRNVLSSIDVMEVIVTDMPTVSPLAKPDDIVQLLANSQYDHFAVTDDRNRLLGIIDFKTIRSIVFNPFKVKYSTMDELMCHVHIVASVEDSVEMIMEKFEESHANYLPILKDDRYYGFIYKEKVLEAYREKHRENVIE